MSWQVYVLSAERLDKFVRAPEVFATFEGALGRATSLRADSEGLTEDHLNPLTGSAGMSTFAGSEWDWVEIRRVEVRE